MIEIVITVILFLAFISVREYFVIKERQTLLDRIMSKTYVEFKDNEKIEPSNYKPEEEDETVPLDEAKEDLVK